jgi:predicted nucleic acid-binding protein
MTASAESPRALVDTNIIIYAYDRDDPAKHAVALALLERLSNQGGLVFSAQVFNEFCSVMMRPSRAARLAPNQLSIVLRELEATGDVVPITPALAFLALDAMPRHGLSFWDALIWAAAADNGIPVLYTEDFQDGRDIEGVRFVNPFADGFSLPP